MIMGGSTEEKLDHPTQKPVELMTRPIMNQTRRGDVVCEPFLGWVRRLLLPSQSEESAVGLKLSQGSLIRW